ncbi:Katanin p60 ATPase-containing subunit A1 [Thoreauomyces humboldtii]|nr:Katanin p60 ATPase-containing subunit A1 [Thoreauomyces humboldtii]
MVATEAASRCVYWTSSTHPDKVHALAMYPGVSTEDLRLAFLSNFAIHPTDVRTVITIKAADASILPLSPFIPSNSPTEPYMITITKIEESVAPVASRTDLEDVHADIEALKFQLRVLKKQLLNPSAPHSTGATILAPLGAEGARRLTDDEASELVQDLEMLAVELGVVADMAIKSAVLRRFLFGIKDAVEASPVHVDFRQSHLTTRTVFRILKAHHIIHKWKPVDTLVCFLSTLTYGIRRPVSTAGVDSIANPVKAGGHAQDQFSIILSLLNEPATNFLAQLDPLDFKEWKEALKYNLMIMASPKTLLAEIPPRNPAVKSTTTGEGSKIPSMSAIDRFNAMGSSNAPKAKRRGSMDLGRGTKKTPASAAQEGATANPVPRPIAASGGQDSTLPVAIPTAQEEKIQRERHFARLYEQEGIDKELAALIRSDMLEEDPNIRWTDIAGQEEAKTLLAEALVLPALMPEFFQGIRRPWRGILMTGPPGTGKTLLAKAVATECNTTFFNISASSLGSKYRGESEKLVRTLFAMARIHAPSTIFIDEVDSVASARGGNDENEASRRVKSELLVQMDGVGSGKRGAGKDPIVMVLAATNLPWLLDEAMRRRLEKRIYIGPPDQLAREQMLKIALTGISITEDVDTEAIAKNLDGFSGADIANLCRDAAMMHLRRQMKGLKPSEMTSSLMMEAPISGEDFTNAMDKVQSSLTGADIERYDRWLADYGSA